MPESKFAQDILHFHNLARKKYGNVAPLTLDSQLSSISQNYANKLAYYDTGLVHNQDRQNTGENLYSMTNMKPTAQRVVNSWIEYEAGMFDFENGGFSSNTGHFTQCVWANTRKIGVGIARSGDTWYVVANYFPAGNVYGRYRENVFPANTNQTKVVTNNTNTTNQYPSIDYNNQYYYYQPQLFFDQNLMIANQNNINRRMYTTQYSVGANNNNNNNHEPLYVSFERYLSDKNNRKRWRELLLE